MEAEQSQTTFGMRDFVLSRLTHEAQTAPEASARIKALDLLGKSEALWTTVHRTEKAINPSDLASLKAQLETRLRHALTRLGQPRIMDVMESDSPITPLSGAGESGLPGPHPLPTPLEGERDSHAVDDTIPRERSVEMPTPPVFSGGPAVEMCLGDISVDNSGGSFPSGTPRELTLADLGL